MKNELAKVLEELQRISDSNDINPDLLNTIELITCTMQGMKDEE